MVSQASQLAIACALVGEDETPVINQPCLHSIRTRQASAQAGIDGQWFHGEARRRHTDSGGDASRLCFLTERVSDFTAPDKLFELHQTVTPGYKLHHRLNPFFLLGMTDGRSNLSGVRLFCDCRPVERSFFSSLCVLNAPVQMW